MPLRAVLTTAVLGLLLAAPAALAAPPAPVTTDATDITPVGATLNGTADPKGQETSAFFQYGTTKKYGKTTTPGSVGAGNGPVAVAASVGGLQSNKTYHYRIVAKSPGGTEFGKDKSFKTASPTSTPVFTPNPVTFGQPVSVSGQIVGSDVAGAHVSLFGRPFPFTDPFTQFGNTVVADAQGNYIFVLSSALTTTQFEVRGQTSPPFTSTIQTLQVASRITFHVGRHVRKGRRVRFRGIVQPAQDGIVVLIQKRRRDGTFANFTHTTLHHSSSSAGLSTYSIRKRLHRTGNFRAVVQSAGGAVVAGTSSARSVRVTRR